MTMLMDIFAVVRLDSMGDIVKQVKLNNLLHLVTLRIGNVCTHVFTILFVALSFSELRIFSIHTFLRSQVHNRQTRSSSALDIPLCRLSTGQRSFAYRGAKLWNSLNSTIKSLKCPKNFRRHLANVLLG